MGFPASPSSGDKYTIGIKTYTFNGYAWDITGTEPVASMGDYPFTATAGQTSFAVNYDLEAYIEVYRQGFKLNPDEFVATDGTSVVLNAPADEGDSVVLTVYMAFQNIQEVLQAFDDSIAIDERVSRLTATSYVYNIDDDLESITYDLGYKSEYIYTNGELTQVLYKDTDGLTLILTVDYGYTNGALTSVTRTEA